MKNDLYRGDISGLRAVAVLLVIFYHVGFASVSGGFIGVDVFFVLSGFLITSVVYKEALSGHFSYKQFYLRRVRRLIPVLLVVIAVTCLVFWFVLLPEDYYRLSSSAIASLLSISNFYFKNITAGYWGASSQSLPLIHTWSLSVEEQFYFIWPALMIAIHKFLPRQQHKFLIASCVVVLLFLSEYLSRQDPDAAYYLLPARAFELLSGVFLAVSMNTMPAINSKLNHVISLFALFAILLMSWVLNKGDVFPGYNAAIVCFATLLLLFTGKDNENAGVVNRILANPVLVYVGLISYSLYLWHWPIIAFFNYFAIEKTLLVQGFIILLTFALSVLSYHGVEQVFRFKWVYSPAKTFIIFLAVPIILLLAFALASKKYDGFPNRFSGAENEKISVLLSGTYRECLPEYCDKNFKNNFSKEASNADFLLVGDSHAGAIEGFFNVLANDAHKRGMLVSSGGTPFLLGVEELERNSGEFTRLSEKSKRTRAIIEAFHGDTIVLTARFSKYTDPHSGNYFVKNAEGVEEDGHDGMTYEDSLSNFKYSLLSTIDFILSQNKKLIIVEDVPYFPLDKSKCEIFKTLTGFTHLCSSSESLKVIADFQKTETEFFAEIKTRYPMVTFINTRVLLCDEQSCSTTGHGITLYKDNGHLNYIGSKKLGEAFLMSNPNPLATSLPEMRQTQ